MKKLNWKTTLISFITGSVFLYVAFRNVSFGDITQSLQNIPLHFVLMIVAVNIMGIVIRAWRWWYMLPAPRLKNEFFPAQRALAICYAANNFIPRSGEFLRIYFLRKETNRSMAVLSSTVILDRFFLDLLAMVFLMAYALTLNAQLLTNLYEHAYSLFWLMLSLSIIALAGLLFLAFQPQIILKILKLLKLNLFPSLFKKITYLIEELSLGMSSIKKPSSQVVILSQTVLLWFLYLLAFTIGLTVFEIPFTMSTATLAFSISILGVVFPSPGAIGTYHFFTKTALIHLFAIPDEKALAFAILMHGLMYSSNTIYGFLCFLYTVNFKTGQKNRPA